MILVEVRSWNSFCSVERYMGIVTFGGPAETRQNEAAYAMTKGALH